MEMTTPVLPGFHEPPTTTNVPTRWLMVTNQRNLLYMLAAGLVMSPKGFGNKYYKDVLCNFPGWIPLFAERIPKSAIDQSVSEATHLIPCLGKMDLSSLRGKVKAIGADGAVKEIIFPDGIDGSVRVLLIPAPLPITWLVSIIFQSRAAKTACNVDGFGKVPLVGSERKAARKLFKVEREPFSGASDVLWPPDNLELPNYDIPVDGPLAAGAMMAMLQHMSNLGDIGVHSCRLAFDAEDSTAKMISDTMISTLGNWQLTGQAADTSDVLQKLFWGAIDKLVAWRSSGAPESSLDVLLDHLENATDQLEQHLGQALTKLIVDLKFLAGFGSNTITELFKRHPKSFSRAMILFFLREECAELLEFKHPLLNKTDYVVAAILFAARGGWLRLPPELSDYPGLPEAVSHRMATMAQRIANTGIDLGTPPGRPKPLRELFTIDSDEWSKSQKEAALWLAGTSKWSCIRTRISLGKGGYSLVVDGKGMHILIDGEAKAVLTEVDSDQFFVELARDRPSSKKERKVRDLLKT